MTATRSRWRVVADRVIAETLARLPATASDAEKRRALRDAYPFGEREFLPYGHWLKAVQAALGPVKRAAQPAAPLPLPRPSGDDTLDTLLLLLHATPTDPMLPTLIADRLEETGQESAAVRKTMTVEPVPLDVAQRLWPGCKTVHVGRTIPGPYSSRVEIHSRHGAFLASYRDFEDQVLGKTLLVDPEIKEAVAIEKAAVILALFAWRRRP